MACCSEKDSPPRRERYGDLAAEVPLFCQNRQMKPSDDLSLRQAQQKVDEWIRTIGVRYFSELTNLGILMEEVGELSRILVRRYGDQSFKAGEEGRELADELADVLWVVLCLANQTGVDLTD